MLGAAILILACTQRSLPVELAPGVHEYTERAFALPVTWNAAQRREVELLRLFVSTDHGKTWTRETDVRPGTHRVVFSAPRDGLYWFALQSVLKDGTSEPAELADLTPAMKILVNANRRPVALSQRASADKAPPLAAELAGLIDRADRLVVRESPRGKTGILFESEDRRDLNALKGAIKVTRPDRYVHCMCDGSPAIELYRKGELIGQITNHHAALIRCTLWESDVRVTEPDGLLTWFDQRKILAPRREYEEAINRARAGEAAERKWRAAMPSCFKPLWESVVRSGDKNRLDPLRKALAEHVKDKRERVRALLAWYGCGEGPWSGYPAYEDIALKLLLEYETADVLAAVESANLRMPEIEGLARLLAGFEFSRDRPDDVRGIPAGLRARLLEHGLAAKDDDKRRRAQHAFRDE